MTIDFNQHFVKDDQTLQYYLNGSGKLLGIKMHHQDFKNMSSEDIMTELAQFLSVNQDSDIQGLRIQLSKKHNILEPEPITEILDKMPKLKYFGILGDVKDLSYVGFFDTYECCDLSAIALPPKLQCLELAYLHIDDQKKLPKFPNSITKLNLSENDFPDLSAIDFPQNLEELNLMQTGIKDQKKLPKFPNSITKLNVSHNRLDDLSAMDLPPLEELDVSHTRIKDQEKLPKLPPTLKKLKLSNPFTDLSASDLPPLEELNLSYTEITNPKKFPPFKEGLKILTLQYSKLDDLSDLNIPSTVEKLNFDYSKVSDLNHTITILSAKLENWKNITNLSLSLEKKGVNNNITPETIDAFIKHYKSRKNLKIDGINTFYNTSYVEELTRIYKAQKLEDTTISSEDVGNMALKVAPSDHSGEIVRYIIEKSKTPNSGWGSCPPDIVKALAPKLEEQQQLLEITRGLSHLITSTSDQASTSNTAPKAVLNRKNEPTPGR